MNLVVWNCSQALHRKSAQVLDLSPDIAVIPTAARQARTLVAKTSASVWIGDVSNKGLGVYAFGPYRVELLEAYDKRLQWIAPVLVRGPRTFVLFGVWAQNQLATEAFADQRKRGQVAAALEIYEETIRSLGHPLVVAGDFGSCPAWDRRDRQDRHATTVSALAKRGLKSAYHAARNVPHGDEPEPTFYRGDRRGHHTSFCFVPEAWLDEVSAVSVGDFSPWVEEGWSDHVPLTVAIALSAPGPAAGSRDEPPARSPA